MLWKRFHQDSIMDCWDWWQFSLAKQQTERKKAPPGRRHDEIVKSYQNKANTSCTELRNTHQTVLLAMMPNTAS
jgi:hypothetical protein